MTTRRIALCLFAAALAGRPALGRSPAVRLGPDGFRTAEQIYGIAFSPDGELIATGGPKQTVILWDAGTGRRVRTLFAGTGYARCEALAFSPDGMYLATNTPAAVWDVASGRRVATLGTGSNVRCVAFSRTTGRVAYGTYSGVGMVGFYDIAAGRVVGRLKNVFSRVYWLDVSADGRLIAVGGGDGGKRAGVWDVATGDRVCGLPGHTKYLRRVRFLPGGRRVVTACTDSKMRLFDAATGKPLRVLAEADRPNWIFQAAVTRAGRRPLVAADFTDGTIRVQDADTGAVVKQWMFDIKGARTAFSPDGQTLALAAPDATGLRLYDWKAGRQLAATAGGHAHKVVGVRFADGGRSLASLDAAGGVVRWDLTTGEPKRVAPPGAGHWETWHLAPDGRAVLIDEEVPNRVTVIGPDGSLGTLAGGAVSGLSGDGRLVAVVGDSGYRLWDLAAGKAGPSVSRGGPGVWAGARLSRDGALLAAPEASAVGVWDARTGKRLHSRGFSAQPSDVEFTPDGRLVVLGAARTELWDFRAGRLTSLGGGVGSPVAAASPDGALAALAGGSSGAVRVVELLTGRDVATWDARDSGGVRSLDIAPGGHRLAAGLGNSQILLWDFRLTGDADRLSLAECWQRLADADPKVAYPALWSMAARPESVAFLRGRLKPAQAPDAAVFRRALIDLDADAYRVRRRATDRLVAMGGGVEPGLRAALAGRLSAEARRRARAVLRRLPLTARRRRERRAVQVLAYAGTGAARRRLRELSGGLAGAWLTRVAAAASN